MTQHPRLPRVPALLATALAVLALSSCGKKGAPLPPIKVRPQSVSDLTLRQEGKEVVLAFGLPTTLTTGIALGDVKETLVLRLRGEEPEAPAVEGDDAPRDRFMPAEDFLADAEVLVKVGRADVARALVEGKIEVRDDLAGEPVGGAEPYRYYYGVVVVDGDDRESDLSNVESLVPLEAPGAPEDLVAEVRGSSVKLDWKPPSTGKPPVGYLVYRTSAGLPTVRVTSTPVKETDFTDTPPDRVAEATYLVRSAATAEGPFVESAGAARATVDLKDTRAPEAPTKLRTAAGPGRVEVYWDRSSSADVTGYVVYRAEKADGSFRRLTEKAVPETVYLDDAASAGTTYHYAVAAVDSAGNEGSRSASTSGRR